MPGLFDDLFDIFDPKPTKSYEQKSSERAYRKAVREGEKGDGHLEVAGDELFGWLVPDQLVSEEHKARIAGLREGHRHGSPRRDSKPAAAAGGVSDAAESYSASPRATSKSSGGRSWLALAYLGVCASLLLAYFTVLILNQYHVIDAYKLLGITPQGDFWALVSRLWTWTANPLLEGVIIVVFAFVGICLLPGLIACGFWLVVFAIALGLAGALLGLTAIEFQQNAVAGIVVGLISTVLLFFLFRWLLRLFAKALFA